jgi:DNA repair exonuclease SbcCD nuclease subunit
MKVLVIGDTHFDNSIKDYLEAQLRCIEDLIRSSKPGVVVFLGDIFHHRNPNVETLVKVWSHFQEILSKTSPGLSKIYILRGNHDSANKADDGMSVLETFENADSKVKFIQFSDIDFDLKFGFIPHYENEKTTIEDVNGVQNPSLSFGPIDIIFGHFGYAGCINAGPYFDFKLKKEDLKKRTILGHIHKYSREGNVTILGTPYSTTFGECDYPHYVGELERLEDGSWSELKLITVEHGPRHYVCSINHLEQLREEISDPRYFTILRVLMDKFSDETTNDLRNKILNDYRVGYVDLKFQPILDKKLSNRISNYQPTTKLESLTGEVIDKYLDEQTSTIPKELLKKGLDEIKTYEDIQSEG